MSIHLVLFEHFCTAVTGKDYHGVDRRVSGLGRVLVGPTGESQAWNMEQMVEKSWMVLTSKLLRRQKCRSDEPFTIA